MNDILGKIKLKENQLIACNNLHSGSILAGGVGSGKTYISIFWASRNSKGRHIYVITEAVKRDKVEEGHTKPDWQESFDNCGIPEESYTVDSWNNIKKYEHVRNALFLFDEQRAISYNPYSKTSWGTLFVKIALQNEWILASATPGDEWIKFLPVFIANGFFPNKTAFLREHVVFDQYAKFPKIKRYTDTYTLEKLRKSILVPVDVPRKTIRNRIDIMCEYNEEEYKKLEKDRFNYEKGEPYDSASEFASALRKVSNTSPDRINQAFKIIHQHKRIIIFYRFNYERDILIDMAEDLGKPYSEWTGHAHQPIPEGDTWIYICQYSAASKAWSCISTNIMMFFSVSGSYNTMEQCEGRIDRLNTSYTDLKYYYMQSNSSVDRATMRSLRAGKNFNESAWIKKTTSFDFKSVRKNY